MGRMTFGTDNNVTFDPGPHTYTDGLGQNYKSVSRILSTIEIPFDREGISKAMAKGDEKRQAQILAEWEAKKDSSINRGNWIHDNLENFHKYGKIDERLRNVADQIKPLYENYFRVYTEVLLSDVEYLVAGQTDLVVKRQRSHNSLFDFYDYKTNESKGIVFDSVNRKKDPWSYYNKFFLHPFSYLEDCNYNRYSMQLSLYALIAQRQYGINIGRLALIFIDNDLRVHIYPVSFMRYEAEILLAHAGETLKPLPSKDNDDW